MNDGTDDSQPDMVQVTVEQPNTAPVANAGDDQTVNVGDTVTLDGSMSSDGDGDSLSYTWSTVDFPVGASFSLLNTNTASPSFVPNIAGTYQLRLTVNDGTDTSTADDVLITAVVPNTAPVANAGVDIEVTVGETADLNAGGSSDSDGDTLSYLWTLESAPTGSAAALSSTNTLDSSLTTDLVGDYVVSLVVDDGTIDSATDTITITALAINNPPVAIISPHDLELGSPIYLNGSSSYDPDGDSMTSSWTITGPTGSSVTSLNNDDTLTPDFTPDIQGTYKIKLFLDDGRDVSDSAIFIHYLTPDVFSSSDTFPIALDDNGVESDGDGIAGTTSSTIDVSSGPTSINHVFVILSMTHSDVTDLHFNLMSPASTTTQFLDLFTNPYYSTPGFNFAYFIENFGHSKVPDSGSSASADTGYFQPDLPLDYYSENSNGTWTLQIVDNWASNTGELSDWKLGFFDNAPPFITTVTSPSAATAGQAVEYTVGAGDVDGDTPSYLWEVIEKPYGATYTLDNASTSTSSFTADDSGIWVLRAEVSDGEFITYKTHEFGVRPAGASSDYTSTGSVAIPDNDVTGVTSTIGVSGAPNSITHIEVLINISHTYVGDLTIKLTSPDSTEVVLSDQNGLGGQNYSDTNFSDYAVESIITITALGNPYTGDYKPEEALSGFSGLDANGTWTLTVIDSAAGDTGTIDDWTLKFW